MGELAKAPGRSDPSALGPKFNDFGGLTVSLGDRLSFARSPPANLCEPLYENFYELGTDQWRDIV